MIKIDKTLFFIVIAVLLFLSGMIVIIFGSQHKLLGDALASNKLISQETVVLTVALDDCQNRVTNLLLVMKNKSSDTLE